MDVTGTDGAELSGAVSVKRASDDGVPLLELLGAIGFRVNIHSLDVTFLGTASLPLLGQPPGRTLGGLPFWRSAVGDAELSQLLEVFRAVAEDGQPRRLEHAFRRAGRGSLWIRTSLMPHPELPFELLGAMLDLTTSHENERQWREVESWLAALGEALPFDFWICDRGGRFILQNPASERRLGNVAGRGVESLGLPAETRQLWERGFTRALRGETVREEHQSETDGRRCCFVRVVAPVWDAEGEEEVHGVLGVDIDVTELKLVEERLRSSLEELARVQGAALQSRQLAAVGEMAAVIAHEVRNPLGSMVNALSLLRRDPALPAPHVPLWKIIEEEAGRIDWLVTNLLEFVRPMVPELEPTALAPLVEEALRHTLRTEEPAPRLRITRSIQEALPPVPVDAHLLRLALGHVFRNAIQATPPDGELDVSIAEERAGEESWARIVIRDSGPGITPGNGQALFEPFFSNRSIGNGLGLPIARRVIHEHQGTVELSSEGERGTTCIIRLRIPEALD